MSQPPRADPAVVAPLVLVVDDEAGIRLMVSTFLLNEGYRVETAETGLSALAAVERELPEVMILDLHLPVMDGWELVETLRSRGLDLPIVLMTAARDAHDSAERLQAAAYVSKPLSLPLLLRRIDTVLGTWRPVARPRPLVLVVDDDPSLAWVVTAFLRHEGYRVDQASTGEDAVFKIGLLRPGLVLLDMQLPDLHGSQIATFLREQDDAVPIVVMTAAPAARSWAEQLGAEAYVGKPLDFGTLLQTVQQLVA